MKKKKKHGEVTDSNRPRIKSKNHRKRKIKEQVSKSKHKDRKKKNKRNKLSYVKKEHPVKRRKQPKNSTMNVIFNLSIAFSCVVAIYSCLFILFFRLGSMDGYSMLPTVNNKDRVVVNKYASIKRFDLVYMHNPLNKDEITVKRVIGLPNESVEFDQDSLLINGQEKSEPYLEEKKKVYPSVILTEDFKLSDVTKSSSIPKNSYFVLGDNRNNSVDSRVYGNVDETLIIGKVTMRLFPFSSFTIF